MSSVELINQHNISQEMLCEIFEDAYLSVVKSEKGNGVYISERYNTWFDIDDKKKEYIRFSVVLKINLSVNEQDMNRAINEVNKKYMMSRAFCNANTVEIDYYLWVNGGIDKKNLIFTYKFFSIASTSMAQYLLGCNVLS
ncbi:YbjN domain-containing protein [Gelatiniphilus marinus]|uniref:YbjN domain-containing protein n=1 Tax=Gelatiniphilus marinus TaxID=1759464 RepID=A0ABW5JTC0_9FLAO